MSQSSDVGDGASDCAEDRHSVSSSKKRLRETSTTEGGPIDSSPTAPKRPLNHSATAFTCTILKPPASDLRTALIRHSPKIDADRIRRRWLESSSSGRWRRRDDGDATEPQTRQDQGPQLATPSILRGLDMRDLCIGRATHKDSERFLANGRNRVIRVLYFGPSSHNWSHAVFPLENVRSDNDAVRFVLNLWDTHQGGQVIAIGTLALDDDAVGTGGLWMTRSIYVAPFCEGKMIGIMAENAMENVTREEADFQTCTPTWATRKEAASVAHGTVDASTLQTK